MSPVDQLLHALIQKGILNDRGYLEKKYATWIPPLDDTLPGKIDALRKSLPFSFEEHFPCKKMPLAGGRVPSLLEEYSKRVLINLGIEYKETLPHFQRIPPDTDVRIYLEGANRDTLKKCLNVLRTHLGDPKKAHIIDFDGNLFALFCYKEWEFILIDKLKDEYAFSYTNLQLDLRGDVAPYSLGANVHQALLDLMTQTLHMKGTLSFKGWPLLMNAYTRGFRCLEKEIEETLFQLLDKEKVEEHLFNCWKEHLKEDPSAAFALAYNAESRLGKILPSLQKVAQVPKGVQAMTCADLSLFAFFSLALAKDETTRLIRHCDKWFLHYSPSGRFVQDCLLIPPFDVKVAEKTGASFTFERAALLSKETLKYALGELEPIRQFVKKTDNEQLRFYFLILLDRIDEEKQYQDQILEIFPKLTSEPFYAQLFKAWAGKPLPTANTHFLYWPKCLDALGFKEQALSTLNKKLRGKISHNQIQCVLEWIQETQDSDWSLKLFSTLQPHLSNDTLIAFLEGLHVPQEHPLLHSCIKVFKKGRDDLLPLIEIYCDKGYERLAKKLLSLFPGNKHYKTLVKNHPRAALAVLKGRAPLPFQEAFPFCLECFREQRDSISLRQLIKSADSHERKERVRECILEHLTPSILKLKEVRALFQEEPGAWLQAMTEQCHHPPYLEAGLALLKAKNAHTLPFVKSALVHLDKLQAKELLREKLSVMVETLMACGDTRAVLDLCEKALSMHVKLPTSAPFIQEVHRACRDHLLNAHNILLHTKPLKNSAPLIECLLNANRYKEALYWIEKTPALPHLIRMGKETEENLEQAVSSLIARSPKIKEGELEAFLPLLLKNNAPLAATLLAHFKPKREGLWRMCFSQNTSKLLLPELNLAFPDGPDIQEAEEWLKLSFSLTFSEPQTAAHILLWMRKNRAVTLPDRQLKNISRSQSAPTALQLLKAFQPTCELLWEEAVKGALPDEKLCVEAYELALNTKKTALAEHALSALINHRSPYLLSVLHTTIASPHLPDEALIVRLLSACFDLKDKWKKDTLHQMFALRKKTGLFSYIHDHLLIQNSGDTNDAAVIKDALSLCHPLLFKPLEDDLLKTPFLPAVEKILEKALPFFPAKIVDILKEMKAQFPAHIPPASFLVAMSKTSCKTLLETATSLYGEHCLELWNALLNNRLDHPQKNAEEKLTYFVRHYHSGLSKTLFRKACALFLDNSHLPLLPFSPLLLNPPDADPLKEWLGIDFLPLYIETLLNLPIEVLDKQPVLLDRIARSLINACPNPEALVEKLVYTQLPSGDDLYHKDYTYKNLKMLRGEQRDFYILYLSETPAPTQKMHWSVIKKRIKHPSRHAIAPTLRRLLHPPVPYDKKERQQLLAHYNTLLVKTFGTQNPAQFHSFAMSILPKKDKELFNLFIDDLITFCLSYHLQKATFMCKETDLAHLALTYTHRIFMLGIYNEEPQEFFVKVLDPFYRYIATEALKRPRPEFYNTYFELFYSIYTYSGIATDIRVSRQKTLNDDYKKINAKH